MTWERYNAYPKIENISELGVELKKMVNGKKNERDLLIVQNFQANLHLNGKTVGLIFGSKDILKFCEDKEVIYIDINQEVL